MNTQKQPQKELMQYFQYHLDGIVIIRILLFIFVFVNIFLLTAFAFPKLYGDNGPEHHPTRTLVPTMTVSPTTMPTDSSTITSTLAPDISSTPTVEPELTQTNLPSPTSLQVITPELTDTLPVVLTDTPTPLLTVTSTPTNTATNTLSLDTLTPTETLLETSTPTLTSTLTFTRTPTPLFTNTKTPTIYQTVTSTFTRTLTPARLVYTPTQTYTPRPPRPKPTRTPLTPAIVVTWTPLLPTLSNTPSPSFTTAFTSTPTLRLSLTYILTPHSIDVTIKPFAKTDTATLTTPTNAPVITSTPTGPPPHPGWDLLSLLLSVLVGVVSFFSAVVGLSPAINGISIIRDAYRICLRWPTSLEKIRELEATLNKHDMLRPILIKIGGFPNLLELGMRIAFDREQSTIMENKKDLEKAKQQAISNNDRLTIQLLNTKIKKCDLIMKKSEGKKREILEIIKKWRR